MGRDGNRQQDAAAGTEVLYAVHRGFDGCAIARDDDLAGGVAVGDGDTAQAVAQGEQLGDCREVPVIPRSLILTMIAHC